MVVHWIREYGKGFWKHSLANILGALICYAIVLILFLFRLEYLAILPDYCNLDVDVP